MSDDLRARIAAIIKREQEPASNGGGWYRGEWSDHVADAVIRELNLDISHTYRTSQGREVCVEGFWTEEVNDD